LCIHQAWTSILLVDGYRPKAIEQKLIVCIGESEAEITNNKRLRSRYCTVKANYRQIRSIACLSATAAILIIIIEMNIIVLMCVGLLGEAPLSKPSLYSQLNVQCAVLSVYLAALVQQVTYSAFYEGC